MTKILTAAELRGYRDRGYHFPARAMSTAEAAAYRARLETSERLTGGLKGNRRHKVHLLFTWANELVRHPRILDAVEDVLGPDIICWGTDLFIKEPNDPSFVSWHQDSTYWGLEPPDVVTAWIALSEVPLESGPMRFLTGSHKGEQLPHVDTFDPNNLLSRGQAISGDIPESEAVNVPLRPGEISLHHIRTAHASHANRTGKRRIGFAARYIGPHVRQVKGEDSGMLVRGVDRFGHFHWEPEPVADMDDAARAAHAAAVENQARRLYEGTDMTGFRE